MGFVVFLSLLYSLNLALCVGMCAHECVYPTVNNARLVGDGLFDGPIPTGLIGWKLLACTTNSNVKKCA